MRFPRTAIIILIAASFLMASCARQPSQARSMSIIKHHFKKYGKEYPDTIYGKSVINDVEITSQEEIHKHLVAVEAFLTLKDGTVKRVYVSIEKGPLGWRFVSWENAS